MQESILSKKNSSILRGVAIMFIMLHNFLHYPVFGFSQENEMAYSYDKAEAFLNKICSMDANWFGEFFSFLGWIGVPVFVFLTGYGLAKKYPSQQSISVRRYLGHSYLKLFFLMLPAILFFVLLDIKSEAWGNLAKHIFALSMLHNLDYPHLRISPGVYWYFSLTFQYYVVFMLFRKYFSPIILLLASVLSLVLLYYLGRLGYNDAFNIYRHCFTGWFPLFAIGVYMAGKIEQKVILLKCSSWVDIIGFILLLAFVIIMNMRYVSWIMVPIVALIMFIFVAKLLIRINYFSRILGWIGGYSAVIFVSHPIARKLYFTFHWPTSNLVIALVLYIGLSLLIAFFYQKYYVWLKAKYIK